MKKIINEPSNFVEESIEGLVKSHPDIYAFAPDNKRVITRAKKSSNKVGIVSGGGSGHLPVFTGYVGKGFLVKELTVNSKSSISLQKHHHRSEHWMVIQGTPKITINNNKFFKKESQSAFIPKGAIHRIENLYKKPVKIIEVQTGSVLKESDIVRYQDIYGRIK